ncbi:phosphoribosylglycinamide formyltransferase [Solemya velum gill symbiont]|uniref:Phosphoribosylglycinamide formyltransferase n=1 Tax=Solemya velum gill symbiont TaxID=2340 RepID=A0A0B0HA77_SOVGS|nr:phosphoribosylglycinamide formyltransferase [Solemya velum gill symbiont]KHF25572.1 formyltetrahydrofolate-dependent phosphoribosylglycinamide formyltransferase [Solemya velum gill symbiont]OOY52232.1 phosphoribosylglycinamide formyltransferase [Solemya velum gill symbiont]OOY56373.1 phosphoribosylglycinamide formyltransferase [Solemya velum gill symbiont]OOY57908.1 phosphoribosylglycinamide formyltransferase [Solemya velum gill symbiont]OOY60445.1 phosphoribosylglycinamide formyltransferas
MLRIVVLVSGNGSNLQAILDAVAEPDFAAEVVAVVSNRPDAYALQRAANAGVKSVVVDHAGFADRDSYDAELINTIDSFKPSLVLLAGFMRILTSDFVRHYSCRLLNIHPSLLPDYKGLHTHRRVLENGDTTHGASVHFVTEELDGGPVVLQARIGVEKDDTSDSLAERLLKKEHQIYPLVVNWIAEGRLTCKDNKPLFDGEPLDAPLQLDEL